MVYGLRFDRTQAAARAAAFCFFFSVTTPLEAITTEAPGYKYTACICTENLDLRRLLKCMEDLHVQLACLENHRTHCEEVERNHSSLCASQIAHSADAVDVYSRTTK